MQMRPGHHSRVEIRNSSFDKIPKEQIMKNPLTQSYMEPNLSQSISHNHLNPPTPTPQADTGKKMRRSGLTVLRAIDNEKS